MKKHAYLIIAHNEFYLLEQLVKALDHKRNDIYIHVDKKAKDFEYDRINSGVKESKIYFLKRQNVSWGGDTLVKCEYSLLKAAFVGEYQHYHLLSGVDFPIKSQEYIHQFFDLHADTSFLHISKNEDGSFDNMTQRNTEYHFLQNRIGRNETSENRLFRIERRLIKLQRRLGINRLEKCPLKMYKGAQWFSITHELVEEILDKENIVKKYFYNSYCPDELFLNTIAMNSEVKNKINLDYLRFIDWNRGRPYTFCLADYDALMKSDALFARKFSCATEDGKKLIEKISKSISK